MKTIHAFLLAALIPMLSCSYFLAKKYRTNQPFTFTTKQAYLHYLQQEKHFEVNNVLYLDSVTYPLIFNVISKGYPVYYGSFINDSIEIKKSAALMINEECVGRMSQEIRKNVAQKEGFDSSLRLSSNINRFGLCHAINNHRLYINDNKRVKVFMLYGFAQGRIYDNLYKEVYQAYYETNRSFDLYIILIDRLYQLPD